MERLTTEFGWNLVQQGLWTHAVKQLHPLPGLTPARAPTAAKAATATPGATPGADPAAAKAATAKPVRAGGKGGKAGKAATPPHSMDSGAHSNGRAHSGGGSDASLEDAIQFSRRGSPLDSAQSLQGLTGEAAKQQREKLLEQEHELRKRRLQTAREGVQNFKEQVDKLTIEHNAVLKSCEGAEGEVETAEEGVVNAEEGVVNADTKLKKAEKKVEKAKAKRADVVATREEAIRRRAEATRHYHERQGQKRSAVTALSFAQQQLVAAELELENCTKIARHRETTLADACNTVLSSKTSSPTSAQPLGRVTQQPLGGVMGGVKRPLEEEDHEEDHAGDKRGLTEGLTSGVHDYSHTLSPPNPALSPHTYTWPHRP